MEEITQYVTSILLLMLLIFGAGVTAYLIAQRRKNRLLEAVFGGRERLDEAAWHATQFQGSRADAETAARVRRLLEREFAADLSRLRAEDDFSGNLNFLLKTRNLATSPVIAGLEREFSIGITTIEAAGLRTVRDIVDLAGAKTQSNENVQR